MDVLNKKDEERILAVIKKYYQVNHEDLKTYMKYKGSGATFRKTLHKLAKEGHIKIIQGLGTVYWRHNTPITTVSKLQYKRALKLTEAYTSQLENNQVIDEHKCNKFEKPTAILDNIEQPGFSIGNFPLLDYTSSAILINALHSYYYGIHNISKDELKELSINQLPSISIKQFLKIKRVGKRTMEQLKQLCDNTGIILLP